MNLIKSIREILVENQLVYRILIGVLIVFGIQQYSFSILLFSAILSGLNYGLNNDAIWESKEIKLNKDERITINPRHNETLYIFHQVWIHLFCGVLGSLALYALLRKVHIWFFFKNFLNTTDIILFIVASLGYTGLLPRTLWFFAQRGDIKGP